MVNLPPFPSALRRNHPAAGPRRICFLEKRASKCVADLQMTPRLSAQRPSPVLVNASRRDPLLSTMDITKGLPSSMVVSSHVCGRVCASSKFLNSLIVAAQSDAASALLFKASSNGRKSNKNLLHMALLECLFDGRDIVLTACLRAGDHPSQSCTVEEGGLVNLQRVIPRARERVDGGWPTFANETGDDRAAFVSGTQPGCGEAIRQ